MRHFRIESLISHNKELFAEVKTEAKSKSYPSGKYTIIGRDRDSEMIRIAMGNAMRAGVQDDIVFEVGDYLYPLEKGGRSETTGGLVSQKKQSSVSTSSSQLLFGGAYQTIVTNPPYGNRLQ